jgi:TonB family protein
MGDGARFWRNVTLIAGAHAVLLIAFVQWSSAGKSNASQQVVWLSGGQPADPNARSRAAAAAQSHASKAEPTQTPESEEQPTIAPAKSEIQLPVATPTPTPAPPPRPLVKLSPPPLAKPAQIPKPAIQAPPKKLLTKATPNPKPKARSTPVEENEDEIEAAREALGKISGSQTGGGSAAGGSSARAETQWYGRMLHDRFHNAWDQPTTVIASGTKMSALVRVRIEKSGRVSHFDLVKPTGNVVVDDSVRAVANKVTQLDPLPDGIGTGDHYDVTINFELNPEE